MSICRVFFCVVGRGCLLWPVCSLGKTLLAFALPHSIFQGQICLLLQVFLGEGNSSPLQCSCLENPRDGGAWWAAVYGVTQSRTRLKRLSSSSQKIPWRMKLQPTPVFLPGKSHGQKSLVGYGLRGCKTDMTWQLNKSQPLTNLSERTQVLSL